MKLSHIVPTSLIPQNSGDFVMALANYLEVDTVNEYEQAMIDAKLPIVLDNGAFETGHPDGINNLIAKARRLKPAYIFAPDTLFDKDKTRAGYEHFKYIMDQMQVKYRIGVVVQANNLRDYLEEFKRYNEDPGVSVIGLSYLAISHSTRYKEPGEIPKKSSRKVQTWNVFTDPDYTSDRIAMLEKIDGLKLENYKPIHLLGLGRSYEDVMIAKEKYPYCRYNDTSTCYIAASKGKILTDELAVPGGKIRDKIDINAKPSQMIKSLMQVNIKKVNQYFHPESIELEMETQLQD